jgi:riboflavin kinase/FMN adenylyltransferase
LTAFSQLTAEEFVKNSVGRKISYSKPSLVMTIDLEENRTANIDHLIGFGKEYGFEVAQISVQELNEISVSSKIPATQFNGNIQPANDYLGYSYYRTVV